MALSLATVGGKITAALWNAVVALVNKQGLTSVIPTSVAGSGVAVGAAGVVTFTAATVVNINGCFTSSYDSYLVVVDVPTTSATLTITGVFRLAGTDVTTANYDLEVLQGASAVAAAANAAAQANWTLNGGATGTLHAIKLELYGPALARVTTGVEVAHATQNPSTAPAVALRGLSHRLTTAYDGFTLTPTGGTITGTVRVYGYSNN